MLFAVIPDVEKMTAPAFLSPQRMVTIKNKELSGADTSGSDDPDITQAARIKL